MLNSHCLAFTAPGHARRFVVLTSLLVACPVLAEANSCSGAAFGDVAAMSVPELKSAYLACDEHSASHRLDAERHAHCNAVADALQRKAFGGDFDKQLAWWRSAKAAFGH